MLFITYNQKQINLIAFAMNPIMSTKRWQVVQFKSDGQKNSDQSINMKHMVLIYVN